MTNREEVLHFIHRAQERVEGAGIEPIPELNAVSYARAELDVAFEHADAEAALPPETRLHGAKLAILRAMRPFTATQVAFNTQILKAVDGSVAAVERLARTVDRQDQRMTRAQAGIASTDLAIDDLVDEVRVLSAEVARLSAEVTRLQAQLADGPAVDRA